MSSILLGFLGLLKVFLSRAITNYLMHRDLREYDNYVWGGPYITRKHYCIYLVKSPE